ncbi:PREDICTED: uncharacterized protein LOC104608473 [Nelumbo nucifera]|uniref:Uncharacterized protein LOC104608473 n=1 Tax=Nelumbo nucifera TaxID=4432 RepID=A0A1U8AX42_NELNU|nr:PREDICTED: uncharacterized protein LOC104608473 [Nelumbo nucifera]
MEALLSQFTLLTNQALQDKNFDPATIDELMKFFEIEAYNSWAALEIEQNKAVEEAEASLRDVEDYLDSILDGAMDDFRRFEEEMDKAAKAELESLVQEAKTAKKMGKLIESAATIASKKYIEAALSSATASMKSAFKGVSFAPSKVHPS